MVESERLLGKEKYSLVVNLAAGRDVSALGPPAWSEEVTLLPLSVP